MNTLRAPGLELRLVNLPGYSPDFNADEAIWGWVREEATGNLCLGTKALVQERVGNFLHGLSRRKDEVKRRCRTILQSRAEGFLRESQPDPRCIAMHIPPWLWFRSEWNRAALRAAASVVAANLISIRDTLGQDAADFWRFLDALYKIHGARGSDAQVPLGAFWQSLTPSLPSSPIVRSESGEWLKPSEVRIPTGREEESAVRTFGELGIGMVSRNLWSYRNVLTSGPVGVKRLTVDDIADALRKMGLVTHAQPLPSSFQSREALESLWLGIKGVLDNTQGRLPRKSFGVKLLGECTLALGRDGRLWPCHSAIYADEQTRSVFAGCLPDRSDANGRR